MGDKKKHPTAGTVGRSGKAPAKNLKRSSGESESKQAVAFLKRAFAGCLVGFVMVQAFHPDNAKDIQSACVAVTEIDALLPFINKWRSTHNLYWSVNLLRRSMTRKAKKADVRSMNFLHVDCDPNEANGETREEGRARIMAMVADFQPPPNIIIDSGGGYGLFWRLRDPPVVEENVKELEAHTQQLTRKFTADNCWNIDRIMRLPFTTNFPTATKRKKGRGVYPATLIHVDDGAYALADFAPVKAEAPVAAGIPERVAAMAKRTPLLRRRLTGDTNGLGDTTRSGLDYSVTSLLLKQGCFPDEIRTTLERYGHGKIREERDPVAYLQRMLTKLGYAPKEGRSEAFTPTLLNSATLEAAQIPDMQWVIKDWLPEGLTIIAGRPKSGKSRLALNLGGAIAQGGNVLGVLPVTQGRVLMLALEDSDRRLQKRQREIGINTSNLDYAIKWDKGDVAAFEAYLDEHADTRTIFIDTYQRWAPPNRDRQMTAYEVDVTNLGVLQAIAMERHIAIVLIVHIRKGVAEDVFDEVLGSTGLTGTADTLWVLKRQRGEGTATLHVTGRDVEDEAYALEWDRVLFCWKLVGKAFDVIVTKEQRSILDELQRNRDGLTPTQLARLTGKTKNAVCNLLRRMREDGRVRTNEDGVYKVIQPDEEP